MGMRNGDAGRSDGAGCGAGHSRRGRRFGWPTETDRRRPRRRPPRGPRSWTRRAIRSIAALVAIASPASGQVRFEDDFEQGLARWTTYGVEAAAVVDSGDPAHGRVLVLRPNGDAHVLIPGSEGWGAVRLEGEVLFPEPIDAYLGVIYAFARRGDRMDFGDIYIKGNDTYLQVNPHRDYDVGRSLYPELHVDLTGDAGIEVGRWQRFALEVDGAEAHFYVGDGAEPWLTFSDPELDGGALGLQPRSVGADVWVDDVRVTSIDRLSYDGPARPGVTYDPTVLLTQWEVVGPFSRVDDGWARGDRPAPGVSQSAWRPFPTDRRGAVITARVTDTRGPDRVAYFRTRLDVPHGGIHTLRLSTVDDLALWVNGRFHWFIPREGYAWHDVAEGGAHPGQAIPIELHAGSNTLVLRAIGGVYASGGFFARFEPAEAGR